MDDDLTAEKFFKTTVDAATKTSLARCNHRVVIAPSSWSNRRRTDGCGASSSSRWHPRSQGSLRGTEPTGGRIGEYPRRRRGRASRRRRRPGSTSRSYGPRKPTWFARSAPPKTRCSSGSEASTPSKAAATDKLDETLLREFAEKKFPGGYRLLDAAARDAAAAALAAACEHNLRGAIEAEDVASECDMRGALGRLHAYRRMDEDAAREFKAEADDPRRRGGEGSHGSRGGPG